VCVSGAVYLCFDSNSERIRRPWRAAEASSTFSVPFFAVNSNACGASARFPRREIISSTLIGPRLDPTSVISLTITGSLSTGVRPRRVDFRITVLRASPSRQPGAGLQPSPSLHHAIGAGELDMHACLLGDTQLIRMPPKGKVHLQNLRNCSLRPAVVWKRHAEAFCGYKVVSIQTCRDRIAGAPETGARRAGGRSASECGRPKTGDDPPCSVKEIRAWVTDLRKRLDALKISARNWQPG